MTPEDRLRDALRVEADTVEPRHKAWEPIAAGLRGRARRRRFQQGLAAAAAVVLVAAGAAVAMSGGTDEGNVRVVPPAQVPTSTSPETAEAVPETSTTLATTTTGPPSAGVPPYVVAARQNGEIVVLSSSDGAVVRVLVPAPTPTGELLADVDLSRDGETVFFSRHDGGTGCATIYRVPARGGEPTPVGRGSMPTLSPDGRLLAYVGDEPRFGTDPADCWLQRLVVRDLETEAERFMSAFTATDTPPDILIGPDWAPDSRHVTVQRGWENALDVLVVDAATSDSMREPVRVPSGDRFFSHPLYRGTTGALVVRADQKTDTIENETPDPLVVVEPRTGRIVATLENNLEGNALGFDASGRHLLYTSYRERVPALMRWTNGRSVKIAEGFVSADW